MGARTLGKKAAKLSGKGAAKFSGKKAAAPSRKKAVASSRKKAVAPLRGCPSPVPSGKRVVTPSRRAAAAAAPQVELLDDFVTWANKTFQLQLPRLSDLLPGTLLFQMWSVSVEVTNYPSPGVVARAKAQTSLTIVAKMNGIVFLDIRQTSTVTAARLKARRQR